MSLQLYGLCPSPRNIDMKIAYAMGNHWNAWAKDRLSDLEQQSWSNDMHLMLWPHSMDSAATHPLSSQSVKEVTWVNLTMGKVMFGGEFLKTLTAANAQSKWPMADLAEWQPNANGPTRHFAFLTNPYTQEARDARMRIDTLRMREKYPGVYGSGWTPGTSLAQAFTTQTLRPNTINSIPNPLADPRQLADALRKEMAYLQSLYEAQKNEVARYRRGMEIAVEACQKRMDAMRELHEQEIAELREMMDRMTTVARVKENTCKSEDTDSTRDYDEREFVLISDDE